MNYNKIAKEKTEEGFAYWVEGNNRNPPLILVPGFTGTHSDMLDFARQFSKNYYVVIPDLPGWGDSPKKDTYNLTITGYAHFLKTLCNVLFPTTKIIFIGHCMGAVICIEFAHLFPNKVEELFLVGVPYLDGTFSQQMFYHLAKEASYVPKFFRPFFFFFRSRLFAIPTGFFVIQTRSFLKKFHIIIKNAIKQQFQDEDVVEKNWSSLVTFNYHKVKNLSCPIHIIHGEKDMLVQPNQVKKLSLLFSTATLDMIPHAGHMPPIETPIALGTIIKKYLS